MSYLTNTEGINISLFEKIDAAREGETRYDEEIVAAFNKPKAKRVDRFKDYVYYAFVDEKGFKHPKALEFYLWLKSKGIEI